MTPSHFGKGEEKKEGGRRRGGFTFSLHTRSMTVTLNLAYPHLTHPLFPHKHIHCHISPHTLTCSHPHTGAATDLCFSPSNNLLMASVGTDGKIRCYDIQQRKLAHTTVTASKLYCAICAPLPLTPPSPLPPPPPAPSPPHSHNFKAHTYLLLHQVLYDSKRRHIVRLQCLTRLHQIVTCVIQRNHNFVYLVLRWQMNIRSADRIYIPTM